MIYFPRQRMDCYLQRDTEGDEMCPYKIKCLQITQLPPGCKSNVRPQMPWKSELEV